MDVSSVLFGITLFVAICIAFLVGRIFGGREKELAHKQNITEHRRDAVLRSRAVLGGQFSEQLAPYFPDFRYSPTECKFIGNPIDMIIFKGSDDKQIEEVVFLEIKSGKSTLNKQERGLKKAVEEGRVRWEEYRVDIKT